MDTIPRDIEDRYNDCRSRSTHPDESYFVRQLLSSVSAFSSVHIMLDALDECTDKTLDYMITLIRQFKDFGIKVFCTSRDIINLGDRLDVRPISIGAHDTDIRNYLSTRLNKEWQHDMRFLEEIIDGLTEYAKGKSVPFVSLFTDQT